MVPAAPALTARARELDERLLLGVGGGGEGVEGAHAALRDQQFRREGALEAAREEQGEVHG